MNHPTIIQTKTGISESLINTLMSVLSQKDGMTYSSYTILNFSRPAICLTGKHGQKTVSVETAKQIIDEFNKELEQIRI